MSSRPVDKEAQVSILVVAPNATSYEPPFHHFRSGSNLRASVDKTCLVPDISVQIKHHNSILPVRLLRSSQLYFILSTVLSAFAVSEGILSS